MHFQVCGPQCTFKSKGHNADFDIVIFTNIATVCNVQAHTLAGENDAMQWGLKMPFR